MGERQDRRTGDRWRTRGAFAALGAAALLGQVLLLRDTLVAFGGNELVIGAVLGVWLMAVAVGAAVGSRLADRFRRPEVWFGSILASVGPILAAQMVATRHLRGWLGAEPGTLLPLADLLVVAPGTIAPLAALLGFGFPIGCRVARYPGRGEVESAGSVYVLEALGSLAAGLLSAFVLAGRLPGLRAAGLAGAIAAAGALLLPSLGRPGRLSRIWPGIALALGLVVLATPVGAGLDAWTVGRRFSDLSPETRLVESIETRYGTYDLGEREGQFDLFASGRHATSFPDPWSARPFAHLALTMHPAPRRVLVVGGGADGLLQAMLRHAVVERLDHAETDPALVDLVRRHLPPDLREGLEDPRLRLLPRDGRRVVLRSREEYDLIVVDVPEPTSALLNRYFTAEFFGEAGRALREGGVFLLRGPAPAAYLAGEQIDLPATIRATLGRGSGARALLDTEEGLLFLWSAVEARSFAVTAEELGRRYVAQRARDETFCPDGVPPDAVFAGLLHPGRTEEVRRALDSRESPINRDHRPSALLQALLLEDRNTGSSTLFRRLAGLSAGTPFLVALGLGAALVVGVLLLRPARSRRLAARAAVASLGFAAMTVELALLLRLQCALGHVYGLVGAVVAVFMAGLAAGGAIGTRVSNRSLRGVVARLAAVTGVVVLLALATPGLLAAAGGISGEGAALVAFLGIAGVVGGLTGLAFPFAVAFETRLGGSTGIEAAGSLDAADHAAAATGAFLTGVLLLPTIGVAGACGVAATLAGAALLGLLIASRRS